MTQPIQQFLQKESQTLGVLFTKLKQLTTWNQYLCDCLSEEPLLAKHCYVVNLSQQSLFVVTDSPHWQTKLRFLIPTLLPKLRAYPEFAKLQAIISKVEPSYKPHQRRQARKAQSKMRLETASAIREIAGKLEDSKLRKILERIAEHTNSSA